MHAPLIFLKSFDTQLCGGRRANGSAFFLFGASGRAGAGLRERSPARRSPPCGVHCFDSQVFGVRSGQPDQASLPCAGRLLFSGVEEGYWAKGRNKRYPYYECFQKGCEERRKSIRRDMIEKDFDSLLTTLRPSAGLAEQ